MLSASVNGALPFVIIIFWAQGHTQQHPPTQTNHTRFPWIPNFFTGVKQLWLSTKNKDFWTAEFPKSQSDVQLILNWQEIKQILQFNEEQEWKMYPISIADIAVFWESMLLKAKFLLLEIRSFPNLAFQRFFFLVLEINSLQTIVEIAFLLTHLWGFGKGTLNIAASTSVFPSRHIWKHSKIDPQKYCKCLHEIGYRLLWMTLGLLHYVTD